jgi:hypothetical protein
MEAGRRRIIWCAGSAGCGAVGPAQAVRQDGQRDISEILDLALELGDTLF